MRRESQTGRENREEKRLKGIYIHIPFCLKKCDYCDFYSFDRWDEDLVSAYLSSLKREIKSLDSISKPYTLYIGGGTPTILSYSHLKSLLDFLRTEFIDPVEFTVEANPLTLDDDKLRLLKDYGVSRISLGVQSFSDRILKVLGRIHSVSDALFTIDLVTKHFDNFNVDLIYSIPTETFSDLEVTLGYLERIKPPHVSLYSLILDEGTPIYKKVKNGILKMDDEETFEEKIKFLVAALRDLGYLRYEVSNFAISKRYRCLHNLIYWNLRDYYGFGVSAHSFIDGVRYRNSCDIESYIRDPLSVRVLEYRLGDEYYRELIMLSLRTDCGLPLRKLPESLGRKVLDFAKDLKDAGLIDIPGNRIVCTDKGFNLLNTLIVQLWSTLD